MGVIIYLRFFWKIMVSKINVVLYTHTHITPIFFIYSSVNGYLGYFHVLAIVNSASVNIGVVHISF